MDGYGVEIGYLRAAGSAAQSAGEQATPVGTGLVDAIGGLTGAMPGSRSALVAVTLAQAWETRISTWVGEINGYGNGLLSAADTYETNEQAADSAFFSLTEALGWED